MGTYRCVGTASCFSPFYSKGDNFHDFLFTNIAFEKWVHRQKNLIPRGRVSLFALRVDHIYKRGKFENSGVLSPESMPIYL